MRSDHRRKMVGALALLAVALVAGCDDDSTMVGGPDAAAPDLAVAACSRNPKCAATDFECTDGDMVCGCHSGFAFCHPTACPDVTHGEPLDGTPCTIAALRCGYGFEDSVVCVGPENRWAFCGGVFACDSTSPVCCGGGQPFTCSGPGSCVCASDNHVHCAGDGGL